MDIKNWNDLLDVVSSVKKQEEIPKLFEDQSQFLQKLALTIYHNDKLFIKEYAFQYLENYILEMKNFLNDDSFDFLIFKDVVFIKELFELEYELFMQLFERIELTPMQKLNLFNELKKSENSYLEFDISTDSLCFSGNSKLNILIEDVRIEKDDDFELLSYVMDSIPMEIIPRDEDIFAVVLNKKRNEVAQNKETITTKLKTICARVISSPVTKYAGIAFALGLSLTGTAEASMVDAVGYVDALNQNLSQLAVDVPSGCNFGAEILSNNGFTMEFQVQLGDFLVETKVTDLGSTYKGLEQNVLKMEEMKGCGLSKEDVSQMAKQIASSIQKIAAQ